MQGEVQTHIHTEVKFYFWAFYSMYHLSSVWAENKHVLRSRMSRGWSK